MYKKIFLISMIVGLLESTSAVGMQPLEKEEISGKTMMIKKAPSKQKPEEVCESWFSKKITEIEDDLIFASDVIGRILEEWSNKGVPVSMMRF